jgi:sugar O-acyltransferase (sialic acid O-acetyltransferase NeuD family)
LPVVDFETVNKSHPPAEHALYAALVYTQMNRLRTRFAGAAKAMGYELASYVSSRALVWRNVSLGEHCFVFEGTILQPFVTIGDNVVIWSGSHIGHHATIRDNCFIAPEVAISGSCEVGENSFVGINATLVNDIVVAPDCWIGPNVTITRDTEPNSVWRPPRSEGRVRAAPVVHP